MKLTVKDLINYLTKQNPNAKVCFYDSKKNDYIQMDEYLFKKTSNAKEEFKKHLNCIFNEIEDENEKNNKVNEEFSNYFKYVNDDDILIGLKNTSKTLDM